MLLFQTISQTWFYFRKVEISSLDKIKMRKLLFLLFPHICFSESCTQLKQTLGLSSSNPPENLRECNTEEGAEGIQEVIASNCTCKPDFKKCRLSLIEESRINLDGAQNENETVEKDEDDWVWEKDVVEVAGMRFSRKIFDTEVDNEYKDKSLSDLGEPGKLCNFCCRVNNTNEDITIQDQKLGTALTAGVMLGIILVVVLISIVASKFSKCSDKGNPEEIQEPETKTLTNTV